MDRVKRIWYLSHMRAAKVQASLRIRAVSPEPSQLAHTSSESRGTFRQKARSIAPLNGWACAVEMCHDGMLEDTNSLDGAQMNFQTLSWCCTELLKFPLQLADSSMSWFRLLVIVLVSMQLSLARRNFDAHMGAYNGSEKLKVSGKYGGIGNLFAKFWQKAWSFWRYMVLKVDTRWWRFMFKYVYLGLYSSWAGGLFKCVWNQELCHATQSAISWKFIIRSPSKQCSFTVFLPWLLI